MDKTGPGPGLTGGDPAGLEEGRQVGRSVVVVFSASVGLAGVVWGTAYLLLGVPGAALYPYAFALVTVLNGLAFRFSRRLVIAAWIEVIAVLTAPLLLALHLGGFAGSGAIPLWSSLAPIGAMLFLGPAQSLVALCGFAAVTAVTVAADAWPAPATLPATAVGAFTIVNVLAVTTVAVASTLRFTATHAELRKQQRKVRELEKAYLSQETLLRQQERLATLGKLSAGMAHELNNPAAAALRASQQLSDTLGQLNMTATHAVDGELDARLSLALEAGARSVVTDPLDLSDRVDAVAEWLSTRGAEHAWELAEDLAKAGLDADELERLGGGTNDETAVAALSWLAQCVRARRLAEDVRVSTERISAVVAALKGYTHMDGATRHYVDVVAGLEDTLVVLHHRLRGVTVERDIAAEVPAVSGNAGELNQVWTNLIDNAATALAESGTLTLRVAPTEEGLQVQVEDDGPGIPANLVDRVFDPFVTTKPPGEGTGLGLHLAYHTVTEHYGGSLSVTSRPGCTCFTVSLPYEVGMEERG